MTSWSAWDKDYLAYCAAEGVMPIPSNAHVAHMKATAVAPSDDGAPTVARASRAEEMVAILAGERARPPTPNELDAPARRRIAEAFAHESPRCSKHAPAAWRRYHAAESGCARDATGGDAPTRPNASTAPAAPADARSGAGAPWASQ